MKMLFNLAIYLLGLPYVCPAKVNMKRISDPDRAPVWSPAAGPPTTIVATLPGKNVQKLPTGYYSFPDSITIHKAVKSCQYLKSLNLRMALLGCTGFPDRSSLPFRLGGDEKYPVIEDLFLDGYRFSDSEFERVLPPDGVPLWDSYLYQWADWIQSGKALAWWNWRKIPEAQRLKTNAELWADAMDWSQLKRLRLRKLDGNDFIRHISSRLVGLEVLILDGFYSSNTSQWLMSLPPLREFRWLQPCRCTAELLESLLERHGPKLEILELHSRRINWDGLFMSASQIDRIGEMAPNLVNLSIAIERNGTWPFEALEAIARIPQLKTAELWMQLMTKEAYQMDDGPSHFGYQDYELFSPHGIDTSLYQQPLLDFAGINEVWDFMKKASLGRIQKLSVYGGDFSRPWDGPIYHPPPFERYRVAWKCDTDGCIENDWNDEA